ncbi:MAG: hypothetical protein LJE68_09065 [Rhodobacter sp.]|nr:hypothetical protein [Rhodobacter sp.]
MNALVTTDIVRYAHLLAIALGLGASIMADLQILGRVDQRITQDLIKRLKHYHTLVWVGLFAMWATGMAMIYLRTGFEVANFSPKLFSKLAIVSMLTLNAILIGRIAMPMLERSLGLRLVDLPLRRKLSGAWVASVSSASWLLALALGESKVLAASDWSVFLRLLPLSYVASLTAATVLVFSLHGLSGMSRRSGRAELVPIRKSRR